MTRALTAFALLALAGCATTPGPPPCRGDTMMETQLFLGLGIPGGGAVSEARFEDFVNSEVTPRFAEGFTIIDGHGYWRDGLSHQTVSEKSKIIVRLHALADSNSIDEISQAYKQRFSQESVLRLDRLVCARF